MIIGLLFDPIGAEEDCKTMKEFLKDYFPDATVLNLDPLELNKKQLDLLIFDYGGGVLYGSTILGESFADSVYEYHQDHPSCIIVCWTKMTEMYCKEYYEREKIDADFIIFADNLEKDRLDVFEEIKRIIKND